MYNNDILQEKIKFISCGSEILKKMHHHQDVVICSGKSIGCASDADEFRLIISQTEIGEISVFTENYISVKMLDHCEDSFGYFLSLLAVPILECFTQIII